MQASLAVVYGRAPGRSRAYCIDIELSACPGVHCIVLK